MVELLDGRTFKREPLAASDGRIAIGSTISPVNSDTSLIDVLNRSPTLIQDRLRTDKAVLFRGFRIKLSSDFRRVAEFACGPLSQETSEHPPAGYGDGVYRTVQYAPDQRLLWHNENSFYHAWPRTIVFGCNVPAQRGGETPLVDAAAVYRDMPEDIRRKFHDDGVLYVRNCIPDFGRSWQDLYQTESRSEVEEVAARRGERVTWRPAGQLRIEATRPAFIRHRWSNEWSWFNQILHWHPACLAAQARQILEKELGAEDMPRNCYFGDRSRIDDEVVTLLISTYERHAVKFTWRAGDILVVDNTACAHGREPYAGPREHFVAMGQLAGF